MTEFDTGRGYLQMLQVGQPSTFSRLNYHAPSRDYLQKLLACLDQDVLTRQAIGEVRAEFFPHRSVMTGKAQRDAVYPGVTALGMGRVMDIDEFFSLRGATDHSF